MHPLAETVTWKQGMANRYREQKDKDETIKRGRGAALQNKNQDVRLSAE